MKKIIFQRQKLIIQPSICLVFFSLFLSYKGFSQEIINEEEIEIDEKVELNFEKTDASENADYITLFETLQTYKKKKLNLNAATIKDLSDLQLLNNLQINNLLKHIRENGLLENVYELQAIEGFSENDIQKIMPYIRVDKTNDKFSFSLKDVFKYGKSEWSSGIEQTLEKSKGYLSNGNSSYLGSPQKIFSRYRFHVSNSINAGFSAEKDSGEEFFRSSQKQGFDFYSGYVCVQKNNFLKNIILGDYQIAFGQGLTAWSGFGFGKSSDVINSAKSGFGIRPHSSFDEINFFRGIATTITVKGFELTTFISDKKTDATIISSFNDSLTASSLQQSGLHRTNTELKNKNSIREKIFGENLSYRKNNFSIGFTVIKTDFDKKFESKKPLYNAYDFIGKTNINAGIDYGFSHRNFYFFGETAISKNGGFAYLNGVLASLSPTVSISLLHRNYARDYQNFFSKGFSENTSTSNEKGIYFGIETHPFSGFSVSAYADFFTFPWLKYLVDAPSYGNEQLLKMNYSFSADVKMELKLQQRTTFKNATDNGFVPIILPVNKTNYRFQITYKATRFMELINRVEYVNYQQQSGIPSLGYLISQSVYFQKNNFPISASINYTLFQTDTYDSRIYVLENDFYNRYGLSAYFYKGSDISVSLKYVFSKRMQLMLRAAQVFYPTKNSIGSGYDEIKGNTKTNIAAQMKIFF